MGFGAQSMANPKAWRGGTVQLSEPCPHGYPLKGSNESFHSLTASWALVIYEESIQKVYRKLVELFVMQLTRILLWSTTSPNVGKKWSSQTASSSATLTQIGATVPWGSTDASVYPPWQASCWFLFYNITTTFVTCGGVIFVLHKSRNLSPCVYRIPYILYEYPKNPYVTLESPEKYVALHSLRSMNCPLYGGAAAAVARFFPN